MPLAPVDQPGMDLAAVHLPNRIYLAESLREGIHPIIDDPVFVGMWESASLYPVNWIYEFLPVKASLTIEISFHLVLMAVGLYLFCRHFCRSRLASIMTALMVVGSSQVFGRLWPGHLSNLATMVWVPWILLMIDKILTHDRYERGWMRTLILTGIMTAHLLAGHPQYVFYTGMITAVYLVVMFDQWRRETMMRIGIAYLFAVGLAACQIAPAIAVYIVSPRATSMTPLGSMSFFLPLTHIMTALSPYHLNFWRDFWGSMNGWETSFYFGGPGAVGLVLIGFIRGERGAVRRFGILALVAFVLALGIQTPLYLILYDHLPVFASFRGVCKFAFYSIIFLSVVAAYGIDSLGERDEKMGYRDEGDPAEDQARETRSVNL